MGRPSRNDRNPISAPMALTPTPLPEGEGLNHPLQEGSGSHRPRKRFGQNFLIDKTVVARIVDAIDPRALEHYLAPCRDPSRVHAMCEDYRAGAHADFEIDKADLEAGKKITVPMLALWGDAGIAAAASATPLDTWRVWAANVTGGAVNSGHYLPEEAPDETARALKQFFTAAP